MEAVIGTIGGVIFGFVLNEIKSWWVGKRAQRKQIKSVRTLLSLEMSKNLSQLGEYWDKLNQVDDTAVENSRTLQLARRLSELPLPNLSIKVFDSQLSWLPLALDEKEIDLVYSFYSRLGTIQATKESLFTLREQQKDSYRSVRAEGGLGTVVYYTSFDMNAPLLWEGCNKTITDLLSQGNPLHKH